MSKRHLLLLAGLAVLLALTQGCGSGGVTNNSTVPPKAEFLYVTSSNFSGGLVTSQFSSFKLDTSTGTLTTTSSAPSGGVTEGVAADPASKFVFASNVNGLAGFIDSFAITPGTGTPGPGSIFDTSFTCGPFCNHISSAPGAIAMAPGGKTLYYGSSTIALGGGVSQGVGALSVNGVDGSLSVVPGSPFAADLIPIDVLVHPSGKFVYTANIGTASVGIGPGLVQSISCYASDPSTGALSPVLGSPFPVTTPASGFRGLMIHPSGKFLYLATGATGVGSTGNGILGWSVDSTNGSLTPLPDSPFAPGTIVLGGAFDRAGKFLYASNVSSAILGFSVDPSSGALGPMSGLPVLSGSVLGVPVVDPSGTFLFTGDGKNKTLAGFRLNVQTGALTALPSPAPVNGVLGSLLVVPAP